MRRCAVILMFVSVLPMVGCGEDAPEPSTIQNHDQGFAAAVESAEQVLDLLRDIDDLAAAQQAAPRIAGWAAYLKSVDDRLDALPDPTEEDMERVVGQYKIALQETDRQIRAEIDRLKDNDAIARELSEPVRDFGSALSLTLMVRTQRDTQWADRARDQAEHRRKQVEAERAQRDAEHQRRISEARSRSKSRPNASASNLPTDVPLDGPTVKSYASRYGAERLAIIHIRNANDASIQSRLRKQILAVEGPRRGIQTMRLKDGVGFVAGPVDDLQAFVDQLTFVKVNGVNAQNRVINAEFNP